MVSAALAFAVAACGFNATTGTPELSVTSKAREAELGTIEAKKIESLMGLVDDPALNTYISEIGQRLANALPEKDIVYTFKIVDSQTPNAFALPGGYVYVTRGLLAFLNNEDELACVIGHEIAHVAARHSVRQQTRSILASPFAIATGLAGAATSIIAPRVGGLIAGVGEVTTGAVLAGYSREQEREADRIGMELAAKSGWAPGGMTSMLNTLERNEKLVSGHASETGFLDSHPSPPDRAATTRAEAGKLERAALPSFAANRRAFYNRLSGLLIGANPAQGIFIDHRFLQPELGIGIEFPTQWMLYNSRAVVAAAEPDRRAALIVQVVGRGGDPLIAADSRKRQLGFALADVVRFDINGLAAARVVTTAGWGSGPPAMHITWVIHDDRIYEITGLTHPDQLAEFSPLFAANAASFKPLSNDERALIRADRLTVATAKGDETLQILLDRVGSRWSPARAAVANAITEGQVLPEGRAVKASVAVPYPGR
jgi:predicted Zn-dependent protease